MTADLSATTAPEPASSTDAWSAIELPTRLLWRRYMMQAVVAGCGLLILGIGLGWGLAAVTAEPLKPQRPPRVRIMVVPPVACSTSECDTQKAAEEKSHPIFLTAEVV